MDKLKQDLERELSILLNEMPEKNNKSAIGKQKRLQYYIDNQEKFRQKLNEIGKSYSDSNPLEQNDLVSLKDLLNSYYNSFTKSV